MFVSCDKSNKTWENYTLLLPAVSIGNVGQLTIDLLLSSLGCKKIGYFYDQTILFLVGNDPYTDSEEKCRLVTGIDVYENECNKLIIIQQRVPIMPHKKKAFRTKLIDWIKTQNFEKVILLSSSSAYERVDSQLHGSQFRFLASDNLQQSGSLNELLNWRSLELRHSFPAASTSLQQNVENDGEIYIPGGGMTKKFYEDCCKEDLACAVLLLFCSEGDNIPDAMTLVSHLNEWLKLFQVSGDAHPQSLWKIPPSWKLMFGNVAPLTMY